MAQEFVFIGHCFDPKENHDKIWGYFLRPTVATSGAWSAPRKEVGWNCCVFYGRRGKTMQFKANITGWALDDLKQSKLRKGYKEITESRLFEIWPNFIEEAEAKLMWEVLAGRVK